MNRGVERITAKAAERLFGEAVSLHHRGDDTGAEKRLNRLRAAFPDHPDVCHLLGVARLALDRPQDALAPLRAALSLAERVRPDILPGVLTALGSALRRAGDPAGAVATLERSLALSPRDADALFNLGNALADLARFADATARFRAAAERAPRDPEIRFSLGGALARTGDDAGAAEAYGAAVALDPGHAKALTALGSILLNINDFARARAALERALALDPGLAEAHANLGFLWIAVGEADLGVAATRRAVELKPDLADVHSNLVQHMSYSARYSAADILAEARTWNARHAAPLASRARADRDWVESPPPPTPSREGRGDSKKKPPPPLRGRVGVGGNHANVRDPERRLKVGYVGGDFRTHPVAYFCLALFPAHDPNEIETFVYMTGPKTDAVSEKIRAHVRHWRDASATDDKGLAEIVRADGIDVLVDMAGHTANNRLLAFAERAAPVQATGFGVTGTTGMDAVDYILADRFEIPPGFERFYSEAVVRLPDDNVCYAPPDSAPAVAPLPAFAKPASAGEGRPARNTGLVTFGCFNAAAKVTPEAIALWARVLKAIPSARLFLKSFAYADPESRARFARLFAEAGVSESRLILEGPSPHAELLAAYGRADIALDPTPYSGGLTTLESLWMGVPAVTLPGETFASRHSASHVSNAGLPELVAKDADDYVAIALKLASDLDGLAKLRANLRPRLAASSVCDGKRYARGIEAAYRAMWRRWCRDEKPSALDVRLPDKET